MATVNKYRVSCTTESKDKFVWAETAPTTCPTDTSHAIDAGKTVIVDTKSDNEVVIQEEITKTGAHYQARGFAANVPGVAGWSDLIDFSWPFPISVLSAEAKCRAESDKDVIEFLVGPNTVIGGLTADAAAGADWLNVQQSVIDNITVGRNVKVTDGTTTDDCGHVLEVDKTNLKIKVEIVTSNAFLAVTPTYIQMTTKMARELELTNGHRLVLGESKIGGSHIPANTVMRLRYNNKDGLAKRFAFIVEYLY